MHLSPIAHVRPALWRTKRSRSNSLLAARHHSSPTIDDDDDEVDIDLHQLLHAPLNGPSAIIAILRHDGW